MFRMTEYSSLPIRLVVQSINLVAEGVAPDKSRLAPHASVALIHAFMKLFMTFPQGIVKAIGAPSSGSICFLSDELNRLSFGFKGQT